MEYGIGTKVFGDWQIVKEVGEGASGKVYEIMKMDPYFTTENVPRSALKVVRIPKTKNDIKEALSEGQNYASIGMAYQEYRNEIVNEVVLLSKLKSHPNIVSYEDHHVLQQENGIGWDIQIRMELLTSLTDYQINIGCFMTEDEVLKLAKDLCQALVFCQKEGLVHRDIKPQNIFVSTTGQFKLGDFGVARTVEKTMGGLSVKGTESYMAPEVFQNHPYGKSVDIYSLGLVLYMLLNENRLPFFPLGGQRISPKDKENAFVRRMNGEALLAPVHASKAMAKIILKSCAFEPEQRYHGAEEMLQDLEKVGLKEVSSENVVNKKELLKEENNYAETIADRTIGWETYILPQERKDYKKEKKPIIKKFIAMIIVLSISGLTILFGIEETFGGIRYRDKYEKKTQPWREIIVELLYSIKIEEGFGEIKEEKKDEESIEGMSEEMLIGNEDIKEIDLKDILKVCITAAILASIVGFALIR